MRSALPFDVIFPACEEVLDTALRPLPYREMVRRALSILKIDSGTINFNKIAEDVREKMLQARRHGSVFYYADDLGGHFLAAKTYWFQNSFNLDEPIVIPSNIGAAIKGCHEALMRPMIQKNEAVPLEMRMWIKAQGQMIEAIVVAWVKDNWPSLYLPPENENKWNQPCSHDFRLKVGKRIIEIDVAGPNRNGDFGGPYKKPVDLHLLCGITDDMRTLELRAVVKGIEFRAGIIPGLAISPLRMIVWLNCLEHGLDYDSIRRVSYGEPPKRQSLFSHPDPIHITHL